MKGLKIQCVMRKYHLNIQASWNFPHLLSVLGSLQGSFNVQSFSKPDLFKIFSLPTLASFLVSVKALLSYIEQLICNSWKNCTSHITMPLYVLFLLLRITFVICQIEQFKIQPLCEALFQIL